jgi:anion-transporting  ArsA/GET3 family ATPase
MSAAREGGPRSARGGTGRGSSEPLVVVCAGGGGVGKTTTSAALALALARQGRSTLIVTIDPARRLAGAMGVPITDEVTRVTLPEAGGRLAALMPDPRRSLRTFVESLFEDEPEAKARLLENRLYLGLADAAAGVHELVAMNLVARAAAQGAFEVVVIDTAPSRHAIDFVTYPGRLAALLGGRTVAWLAGLAQRAGAEGRGDETPRGGLLAWGTGHVENLLARVTGPNLVRDTASVFGDLALVRKRFVADTQRAADLLLGPRAAYLLVAAPTEAARDDVLYLDKRLDKLGRAPRAIVVNRADTEPAPYVRALREAPGVPASMVEAMAMLEEERASRKVAADTMVADLKKQLPKVPVVRLPFIEAPAPEAVVAALSRELEGHLKVLLPAG